jgi:hypothetical protein
VGAGAVQYNIGCDYRFSDHGRRRLPKIDNDAAVHLERYRPNTGSAVRRRPALT